jgi:hypothetical protein
MNTTLEYSTRVVQEGDRRCKKNTLNDLAYLTPLRIPLMNPVIVKCFLNAGLFGIRSVRYRNEQKSRCRNQSGTGMLRYRTEILDASDIGLDASDIGLDADA